jgi:hypothetical protein
MGAVAMTQSLCETCKNNRDVLTARSRFLLCQLSKSDPAYPKYPPQPVVRCEGYERKEQTEGVEER